MKYFFYILTLILLLFVGNYTYVTLGLYDKDIRKCNAELMYDIDTLKHSAQILYLGESSNFTTSDSDSSKKSIAQLINSKSTLSAISKGAIHASTYRLLIKQLDDNSSVKTVIVTMNLRSFGINWSQSELETNLSRANIIYGTEPPIIKKLKLSFKVYNNKDLFERKKEISHHYKHDRFELPSRKFESVYGWDKEVFDKGVLDEHGVKDQEKTNIACHFIKNYAFVIDEQNPRVKDFDQIVIYCKDHNLRLILHLLPENYQRAQELCGNDLSSLLTTNAVFLKNRYQTQAVFIDNSVLLPDSCFIDRSWPTEHYIYKGRKLIADKITEQLQLISQ